MQDFDLGDRVRAHLKQKGKVEILLFTDCYLLPKLTAFFVNLRVQSAHGRKMLERTQ